MYQAICAVNTVSKANATSLAPVPIQREDGVFVQQIVRRSDWYQPVDSIQPYPRSNFGTEADIGINSPRGNVDVPVLRQIAEGLEVGQGRVDGDAHGGRAGVGRGDGASASGGGCG